MAEREERIEEIHAASRRHPVVQFALAGMEPDEDTLRPSANLAERLAERLAKVEDNDELIAATLGLVDLVFILQERHNSFEAAEVILEALKGAQPRITAAVKDLPGGDAVLGALEALGKDGFGGKKKQTAEPPRGSHVSNAGFDLGAPAPKKK